MDTARQPNEHYVRLAGFIFETGLDAFAQAVARESRSRLSYQAVQKWIAAQRVPAERCKAVEAVTGGLCTCEQLRPDVFGEAPAANLREAG